MKNLFYYLSVFFAFLLVSCQQEQPENLEPPIEFSTYSINLGVDTKGMDEAETKSLISIDAEDFHSAALFAFYTNNGSQVCQSIIAPSKSFSWDLPNNREMDIYCLYNYEPMDISSYLNKSSLSKSTLEGLTFTCTGTQSELRSISDTYGLPKAGITHVAANAGSTISVKVLNLFAKYTLKFDYSQIPSHLKATINVEAANIYNMNQTCHWFGSNEKNTVNNLSKVYDRATSEDLVSLSNGSQATFYVLENCQGESIGTNVHWSEVASTKYSSLSYATFISIPVRYTGENNYSEQLTYSLYLSDDPSTGSNFNITRNTWKTYNIVLPYPTTGDPTSFPFFRFNSEQYTVEPGGYVDMIYTTSGLPEWSYSVDVLSSSGTLSSTPTWSDNISSKTVRFTCPAGIPTGTQFKFTGSGAAVNGAKVDGSTIVVVQESQTLSAAVLASHIDQNGYPENTYIGQTGHIYLTSVPDGTVSITAAKKSGNGLASLDSSCQDIAFSFSSYVPAIAAPASGWENKGFRYIVSSTGSNVVTLTAKDSNGNTLGTTDVTLSAIMPVYFVSGSAGSTDIALSPVGTEVIRRVYLKAQDGDYLLLSSFDDSVLENYLGLTAQSSWPSYISVDSSKESDCYKLSIYAKDVPSTLVNYGSSSSGATIAVMNEVADIWSCHAYIEYPFATMYANPPHIANIFNDSYLTYGPHPYMRSYPNPSGTVTVPARPGVDAVSGNCLDENGFYTSSLDYPDDYVGSVDFSCSSSTQNGDFWIAASSNYDSQKRLKFFADYQETPSDYSYGNSDVNGRVKNKHSKNYTPFVKIGTVAIYLVTVPAYLVGGFSTSKGRNPFGRASFEMSVAGYDSFGEHYAAFSRFVSSFGLIRSLNIIKGGSWGHTYPYEVTNGSLVTWYRDDLESHGVEYDPTNYNDQQVMVNFTCPYLSSASALCQASFDVTLPNYVDSYSYSKGEWENEKEFLKWEIITPEYEFVDDIRYYRDGFFVLYLGSGSRLDAPIIPRYTY